MLSTRNGFNILLFCVMLFGALKWIPIVGAPPSGIQASDLLILVFCPLMAVVVGARKKVIVPKTILLFIAAFFVFLCSKIVHGSPIQFSDLKPIIYLVLSLFIANLPVDASSPLEKMSLAAFAVICIALLYSANAAGVDAFKAMINFITTQDMHYLLYGILRPSMNAFVPNSELVYSGSLMNEFASSVVMLGAIALCTLREKPSLVSLITVIACFTTNIALFSSSAFIVLGAVLLLTFINIATSRMSRLAWTALLIAGTALLIVAYFFVLSYVIDSISGDANSRSTRLDQYAYAITAFSENMLTGVKLTAVGSHTIHNFGLSLAASAGLIGLIVAIVAHVSLFYDLAKNSMRSISGAGAPSSMAAVACFLIFAVTVLFGGGNGYPTSAAGIALGLAYYFSRRAKIMSTANSHAAIPFVRAAPIPRRALYESNLY